MQAPSICCAILLTSKTCSRILPSVLWHVKFWVEQLYSHCRVIIDCSEVFIETPSSFTARSQTYSNYKKHNTIKFLIGIMPFGTISYISRCWGGRVSDKNLTQECSFLSLLDPGEVVLADHGFSISEDIAMHSAHLEIPAFTRGKKELMQREVEQSRELCSIWIHVERVIGRTGTLSLRDPSKLKC